MYLTAHRVLTPDRARRGINASLYLHTGAHPLGLIAWDRLRAWGASDFDRITTTHPGRHVESVDELERGGNLVLSYLDVVAADSIPVGQLESELDRLAVDLVDEVGRVRTADHVAARFWVGVMLGPRNLRLEFEALRAACLELLQQHQRHGVALGG